MVNSRPGKSGHYPGPKSLFRLSKRPSKPKVSSEDSQLTGHNSLKTGTNAVSFWQGKNVLVTGCSGFLGAWLCEELVYSGALVTGLIRDKVPKSLLFDKNLDKSMNLIYGVVENTELIERILAEYEMDTVFHLAAQAIVSTASRSPVSTFETNIRGTWSVMEACRRVPGIRRIVVASSDKAYGEQEHLPYTEDMPLNGTYPYEVSKSCADLLCRSYFFSYGLPVSVTRCGNLFGGGDLNFNRLVPGTIKSALMDLPPVLRSDGTFIRDYFYVKDAVKAYMHLAEKMDELSLGGEAFNFSSESKLTAKEMTELILKLTGRQHLKPVILNQAGGEIKDQYLSIEKARKVLGWEPSCTLEEGLCETIDWYKSHLNIL